MSDLFTQIIETMSYSEDVAAFMDALGPFYEFVDIPGKKLKNVNTNGVPEDEQPNSHNGETEDREKCELNGHLPIHKRSGNADSGSDSDSDMAHLSSEDSSPQQVSVVTTEPIEVSLARELTEASEEKAEFNQEEDEELLVVKVHEVENTTTHTFSLSPNAYSDSESDEEYSEPAELNTQPSQTSTTAWSQPVILDGVVSAVTSTDGVTSADGVASADAVTCGGGDQSHPGGLQMTPRQIQQGSRCDGSSQAASRVSSGSLSTPLHPGRYFQSGGGSGGSGGAGGGWGGTSLTEDVNTQLVIVLRRLQTDMESVLHRLNTLETLTVTQHHTVCRHCQRGNGSMSNSNGHTEASWWPFPELSPRSTFFLLVWPLVLHGGIKLLLLLRSRRRRS
nr:acyl-CoA-binding domain-containing protein 5-B-like isoform X2 [Cherax quadricarinatus]